MLNLIIPDMTCAHCVKTISKAIAAVDTDAELVFDLQTHSLAVETAADTRMLVDAIEEAGYPVEKILMQSGSEANCCGACGA